METSQLRTDLAVEARESMNMPDASLNGVSVTEDYDLDSDVKTTRVVIETKNAAKKLGSQWEPTLP